jgi:WD40 repeat protein
VLVLDVATKKVIRFVRIPKSPTSLCFSENGPSQILYISDRSGDIFRLSIDSGELLLVNGTVSTVTSLAVHNEQLLVADRDEKVRAFSLSTGELDGFLLGGHEAYISALCHVDRKWLVVGGGDEWVSVWALADRIDGTLSKPLAKIQLGRGGVFDIVGLGSDLVAAIFDNSQCVVLIDLSSMAVKATLQTGVVVTSVSSTTDGVLLVVGVDNKVRQYKIEGDDCVELVDQCVTLTDAATYPDLTLLWKLKYRKNIDEVEEGGEEDENGDESTSSKVKKHRK